MFYGWAIWSHCDLMGLFIRKHCDTSLLKEFTKKLDKGINHHWRLPGANLDQQKKVSRIVSREINNLSDGADVTGLISGKQLE